MTRFLRFFNCNHSVDMEQPNTYGPPYIFKPIRTKNVHPGRNFSLCIRRVSSFLITRHDIILIKNSMWTWKEEPNTTFYGISSKSFSDESQEFVEDMRSIWSNASRRKGEEFDAGLIHRNVNVPRQVSILWKYNSGAAVCKKDRTEARSI